MLAAPVTIDPPGEDDHSLVLEGASTAFGIGTTIWAGLTGTVPIRVLERPVDLCGDEVVQWTRSGIEKARLVMSPRDRGGAV